MKIKLTTLEHMLGTQSANPEIHEEFISAKANDGEKIKEELAALPGQELVEKSTTVFARMPDGSPQLWDYQIKGFFKDACGMLTRVKTTKSSTIKAYKKIIDGLIFVSPRRIKINLQEGEKIGHCQRPLRGQTAQGERIALANSESVPAGSWVEIEVDCLDPKHEMLVEEWLNYGRMRGLGQWRNSGAGRFSWEIVK